MAKLKPIKDEKELAAVPVDQPVLVELEPGATGEETGEPELRAEKPEKTERTEQTSGEDSLRAQLEASQEATRTERERAIAAERTADEARREAERLRTSSADTEKELLTSSLASAQADEAAARAAFKTAFEAGDADGMADAQSKIGRAAAKVVNFEGAVAQFDQDAKVEKDQPRSEPQIDIVTAIDRDPKLMPKEREWLKAHTEVLTDNQLNTELSVGYARALKAGHKRGSEGYFQYLDEFLGYAEPARQGQHDDQTDQSDERAGIVAAPVTRDSRSSVTGRPTTPTRITLSPEQRELARTMGLTDVQYARGKLQLDANKKADPERFAGR